MGFHPESAYASIAWPTSLFCKLALSCSFATGCVLLQLELPAQFLLSTKLPGLYPGCANALKVRESNPLGFRLYRVLKRGFEPLSHRLTVDCSPI